MVGDFVKAGGFKKQARGVRSRRGRVFLWGAYVCLCVYVFELGGRSSRVKKRLQM